MKRNPHMAIEAISPHVPDRRWRCMYCRLEGTYDELRAVECSHVYEPCETCGGTPECKPDCRAMMTLLQLPEVHVIGAITPKGKA